MDCAKISNIIDKLKVNSLGRIRGKNRVIDKIHSEHLKSVDSNLMDIRVFVSQLSYLRSTKETIEMIDEFIYKKQIK